MGRASAATPAMEMKRKKKKGRPSLIDLEKRQLQQQQQQFNSGKNNIDKKTLTPPTLSPENHSFTPAGRRSTRRNSVPLNSSPLPAAQFEEDDEDESREKKVKLVVRLPQSNDCSSDLDLLGRNSQHSDSGEGEADDSDGALELGGEGDQDKQPVGFASSKKRKIHAVDCRSDDHVSDQGEKVPKATDALHGLKLESGPTTSVPDKKLLVFILDRLQKKDTYGVFSEPVDPDELPDYHEIIDHPMDFGTVRMKLDAGVYKNLEELEADILLICSNAMQYNAPDTVYFRQAKSIQELAKRDFANLRYEGDDGEPQPKVVRRGRPPSNFQKKAQEKSPADRIGPELSSGAPLASGEDKCSGPNNSNSTRKTPTLSRHRTSDGLVTPHRSRNSDNCSDWSIDWNSEFPAYILRADMKYGKKNFVVDENKRDTYAEYHPFGFYDEPSTLLNIDGDMKRLMAVGLHFEQHAYTRSLARFAANFGLVAWEVASRKTGSVLPPGVKFGPGWVGDTEAHSELPSSISTEKLKSPKNPASDHQSSRPVTPLAPAINSDVQSRPSAEMVEAVRRLSQNELAAQGSASAWGTQGSPFQAQQKSLIRPSRNGFSGVCGYNPSQLGKTGPAMASGNSGPVEGSTPCQTLGMVSRNDSLSFDPVSSNNAGPVEAGLSRRSHYQNSAQHRQSPSIPPDPNARVQAAHGSPSSSLRIGSPQQPDLAIQL